MGLGLRCLLACILPCGAFDLIRVVHINGHVDEYSRPVSAGEILAANPNHVLSKPSSQGGAAVRRIVFVSPEADLKRGHIYFLVPESSLPASKQKQKPKPKKKTDSDDLDLDGSSSDKKKSAPKKSGTGGVDLGRPTQSSAADAFVVEKRQHSSRRRRSGRVGVWRPHLQSISEDL